MKTFGFQGHGQRELLETSLREMPPKGKKPALNMRVKSTRNAGTPARLQEETIQERQAKLQRAKKAKEGVKKGKKQDAGKKWEKELERSIVEPSKSKVPNPKRKRKAAKPRGKLSTIQEDDEEEEEEEGGEVAADVIADDDVPEQESDIPTVQRKNLRQTPIIVPESEEEFLAGMRKSTANDQKKAQTADMKAVNLLIASFFIPHDRNGNSTGGVLNEDFANSIRVALNWLLLLSAASNAFDEKAPDAHTKDYLDKMKAIKNVAQAQLA